MCLRKGNKKVIPQTTLHRACTTKRFNFFPLITIHPRKQAKKTVFWKFIFSLSFTYSFSLTSLFMYPNSLHIAWNINYAQISMQYYVWITTSKKKKLKKIKMQTKINAQIYPHCYCSYEFVFFMVLISIVQLKCDLISSTTEAQFRVNQVQMAFHSWFSSLMRDLFSFVCGHHSFNLIIDFTVHHFQNNSTGKMVEICFWVYSKKKFSSEFVSKDGECVFCCWKGD